MGWYGFLPSSTLGVDRASGDLHGGGRAVSLALHWWGFDTLFEEMIVRGDFGAGHE
jgi:hypothetical protein